MVEIKKDLIPIGKIRKGTKITPVSITIHSTGNESSTAKGERGWLTNPSNTRIASWHYVVGEDIIIQAIPDDEVAFHSGSATGNKTSIGIEMVHTGDRNKVLANTMDLIIMLMKKYNIKIDKVIRHYDHTKKNCPAILNLDGKWSGWIKFKADLQTKLTPPKPVVKPAPNPVPTPKPTPVAKPIIPQKPKEVYVIVTADVLNLREKPDANSKDIGDLPKGTKVKVLKDMGNGWLQIETGLKYRGFIAKKYTKQV
jgi:N-acetylmuramoyl-L-alanine amidase CwlA